MHTTAVAVETLAQLTLDLESLSPNIALFITYTGDVITEIHQLDSTDPVTALLGRSAADSITAVGVRAPAEITNPTNEGTFPAHHTVVHVVSRNGCAVTVLGDEADSRWFGPTMSPQQGRVPDACRRTLGLPTSPPTEPMTNFVVAAWLEVIVRHALHQPGLEWSHIVGLHPAGTSAEWPVTPATLAEVTRSLGTSLDWERFRRVIATVGGFPFGDDATKLAAWMDCGMFSRWAMESLPDRADLIDALEAVLGPATFDRLWATVRFCE